jgi:peptide/nickel transport system permease protein
MMILKRTVNVVITVFGILTLNFFLIHFMPGDPIHNMVPRDPKFNDNIKWDLIEKFHFNDSLGERYLAYIYNTFTGEWGTSYLENRPVLDLIMQDMRWTILLVGTATFLTILFGSIMGALSAYRRGGAFDVVSTSTSLFFYGMPIFWFALLLQMAFSNHLFGMIWVPTLPTGGYFGTVELGSSFKWELPIVLSVIEHMILPAATLAIGSLAGVALIMRSSLVDVMTEDYILTARAKGLNDYQVLRHHALRNGMPPMIALIALGIAGIIGGAYQVEVIFNYPGIGLRTLNAISNRDFPILQFIVVIGGVAVVVANFIADLILIYIDPRIRIG